ncbi:MAG TPA: hypothetical protein DEP53_02990 [Bacteroidetes bacterium]|nr:hypothetical protein [Bacteroidota bacterium]
MHIKRILAREWLYLFAFIIVGFIATTFFYYNDSSDHITQRRSLYSQVSQDLAIGTFVEFSNRLDNSRDRRELFDTLVAHYTVREDSVRHKLYDRLLSDKEALPSYDQYSRDLDTPSRRMAFYNRLIASNILLPTFNLFERRIAAREVLGITDFPSFERRLLPPPITVSFQKCAEQLFSKNSWFHTWVAVLFLYLVFQLVRSLLWSIKTLRTK